MLGARRRERGADVKTFRARKIPLGIEKGLEIRIIDAVAQEKQFKEESFMRTNV